ncbi:MAG: cytochrome-c oxidase, cbb3-type subunit II [Myxococcales bacterium]|nr:cytochrome-c oxidase, cbb3-type subunit II [Myxococcales bacterium]
MSDSDAHWHRRALEPNAGLFAILTTVAISIGGLVEIVPMFTIDAAKPGIAESVAPYTPLEVAGRDIYIREGCMVCHSQMVRPFRDETLRYGLWSRSEEYTWDRPFLLGSRRIGPDLHRVGGKYPDAWHYEHMRDPRSTTPGSVMPPYPWLLTWKIDPADVQASVVALNRVGTPYSADDLNNTAWMLQQQGDEIVGRMAQSGIEVTWDTEIVALTAYLQRLGTDREALSAEVAQQGEETR